MQNRENFPYKLIESPYLFQTSLNVINTIKVSLQTTRNMSVYHFFLYVEGSLSLYPDFPDLHNVQFTICFQISKSV